MFNTRAEPPLSPAHRAISALARLLHRLAAIDLQPAPALLPAEREEEEEEENEEERRRRGGEEEEGTRGHTHTRAWHPLSLSRGKEGALFTVRAKSWSSLHWSGAVQVKAVRDEARTFAEYSTGIPSNAPSRRAHSSRENHLAT